jgi:hypothetical protein
MESHSFKQGVIKCDVCGHSRCRNMSPTVQVHNIRPSCLALAISKQFGKKRCLLSTCYSREITLYQYSWTAKTHSERRSQSASETNNNKRDSAVLMSLGLSSRVTFSASAHIPPESRPKPKGLPSWPQSLFSDAVVAKKPR